MGKSFIREDRCKAYSQVRQSKTVILFYYSPQLVLELFNAIFITLPIPFRLNLLNLLLYHLIMKVLKSIHLYSFSFLLFYCEQISHSRTCKRCEQKTRVKNKGRTFFLSYPTTLSSFHLFSFMPYIFLLPLIRKIGFADYSSLHKIEWVNTEKRKLKIRKWLCMRHFKASSAITLSYTYMQTHI